MSKRQAEIVLSHIRLLVSATSPQPDSDRQLLERFLGHREEAAFAALLDRHAAMVLRVCRRVLHDAHEAEDALQATFLILARKAGMIHRQQSLGSWLYRVAYRVAVRARAEATPREELADRAPRPAAVDTLAEVSGRELLNVLDDELQRLPEKYRAPLVLCYLEGRTQDEAARQLGWSQQVLRGRIERGRAVLRRRLIRRGFGPSVALAGIVLDQAPTPAEASKLLAAQTLRAVLSSFHHPALAVSPHVAALVEYGVNFLVTTKLKLSVALVLMLGVLAAGLGAGLSSLCVPEPQKPSTDPPATPLAAQVKKEPHCDRYGDPLPAGAVARLGTIRLRHFGWVNCVAYSPNGKFLASGGEEDERVRVWDAETGKELRQFHLGRKGQDASPIDGVAFSPDGKLLAAGGRGTELALWDVASGKETSRAQGVTRYIVFAPDSRTVVLGGVPNLGAELLDLQSNKRRNLPQGFETIHAAAFSPDGKLLATAGPKNRLSLWDAPTLKTLRSLRGHEGEVRSLDFSPDGKQFVSGGVDKTIRLWDVASGKELRRFEAPNLVDGVRFTPDGKMLATRSEGRAILWDLKSGRKLRQFICYGGDYSFPPMAFSPDGKKLLAAQGNALQVWETATAKEFFPANAIRGRIDNLAYSGEGRILATVSWEGTIRLWDTATYRELRRFGGRQPGVRGFALSADGRLAATAGEDKTTRLWDAETGKDLFRWDTILNDGFHLAFTPDGQMLASGNGDGSIRLWQTSTGKQLHRLKGHSEGPVYGVAFSPDGQTLLSAALDKTLRLWDWKASRELRVLRGHTDWATAAAFTPDGQTVASAGGSDDRFIRLWDVKSGKELRPLEGHEPGINTGIFSIVFSPDGRMLASVGFGEALHLWEVSTGKERCRFHGQDYRTEKVAFSPDGRILASVGADGNVLFWDATGRSLDGLPYRQRLTH